jgi:hypothetical protein
LQHLLIRGYKRVEVDSRHLLILGSMWFFSSRLLMVTGSVAELEAVPKAVTKALPMFATNLPVDIYSNMYVHDISFTILDSTEHFSICSVDPSLLSHARNVSTNRRKAITLFLRQPIRVGESIPVLTCHVCGSFYGRIIVSFASKTLKS